VQDGDVLVTDMTDPNWEPVMKRASAIVTNRGGRTCFSGGTRLLTNAASRPSGSCTSAATKA
jgi:pyruvate,water dikinase